MKYKYIGKNVQNDDGTIMIKDNDIIVVSEDKKQVYNISTGRDINIHIDKLLPNLINITDDMNNKSIYTSPNKHPFEEITEKMFNTYKNKNRDYGNSFDESLDEWGLSAAAFRMGDKINRFKKYVKTGSFKVTDEGVRDTLSDLATYAIMTIMYLDKKK